MLNRNKGLSRSTRGSPRGAGSRQAAGVMRRRRGAVGASAALGAIPEGDQRCRHVGGSRGELPSSAGVLSSSVASSSSSSSSSAFDWHGIRKPLPAVSSRRAIRGQPAKVSSKKRSALRGVLAAAELDAEEDLCDALERTALQSQRVVMGREATTARAGPSPEHLPLAPAQRLHFTLESQRIGRGSLVVASVGTTASPNDRPVVVSTRPDPDSNTCEIIVQNTGDGPIVGVFTVRFSVFAMGQMANLGWQDDPHPAHRPQTLPGRRSSPRFGATAGGAVAAIPAKITAADGGMVCVPSAELHRGATSEMDADGPASWPGGGGGGANGPLSQVAGLAGGALWQASWQQLDTVL